jgi:hypothetical protein
MDPDHSDGDSADAAEVLASLRDDVASETVEATVYSDDTNMTPMLVVEFERGADRADVVRRLFHAEGPVEVTGIFDEKVVVRDADWGE